MKEAERRQTQVTNRRILRCGARSFGARTLVGVPPRLSSRRHWPAYQSWICCPVYQAQSGQRRAAPCPPKRFGKLWRPAIGGARWRWSVFLQACARRDQVRLPIMSAARPAYW